MNHLTTADASPANGHPAVEYTALPEGQLWWCNSHRRRATHRFLNSSGYGHECCAPGQSGILLPCCCVELTDEVELVEC